MTFIAVTEYRGTHSSRTFADRHKTNPNQTPTTYIIYRTYEITRKYLPNVNGQRVFCFRRRPFRLHKVPRNVEKVH